MDIRVVEKDPPIVEIQDNQMTIKVNNRHEENKSRLDRYLSRRVEFETEEGSIIKSDFFSDLSRPRMQYSYFPLVLLAFFDRKEVTEKMLMTDLVLFFSSFYQDRRQRGLVVEKEKSIFAKNSPTDAEIKRLILFNPLGRSCLVKYFSYDKKSDYVSLDRKLYKSLSGNDVKRIVKLATELINCYYMKLH